MRKIIVFFIALVIGFMLIPGKTHAASVRASGSCGADGDNVTWTLDDTNQLTLSGTGRMKDYSPEDPPEWQRYASSTRKVTVESGVTNIGDYAFNGHTSLVTLNISQSIQSIGDYAFSGCTGLKTLNFKTFSSMESIGAGAFSGCNAITTVNLPVSMNDIGAYAFENCSSLTKIALPLELSVVRDGVFSGCRELAEVYIPGSVTSIGMNSLNCYYLKDVYFTGNETAWNAIPKGTGNTYLSNVTMHYVDRPLVDFGKCGSSLTYTLDVNGLLTVSGKGGTPSASAAPWKNYISNIVTVVFENGVTSIGSELFYYNYSNIKTITIPESVTQIGYLSFNQCRNLETLYYNAKNADVNYSVTFNGSGCDSPNGVTVYIGASVQTIPQDLCEGCYITEYIIEEGNSYYTTINGLLCDSSGTQCIDCPKLMTGNVIIPNTVTTLKDKSFVSKRLTSLTIYNTLKSIGSSAFEYCYSLTDVYFYGTEEEWNAISIASGNDILKNANIHFITVHEAQAPTCTEVGWEAYEECSACDYTTYVEIPALGHEWNEWTVDSEPDCTNNGLKTRTCDRCKEVENEEIPALGHDWDDVLYGWTADETAVIATRSCKRNPAHKETETAVFVSEVTTPAGCTEEGVLTYTAAFTNSAFETKTKTETIPALGHDWTDPVYQWSENNDSCTATRTCRNDESHIETETVESVVTWVAPTVYAEGSMTYSVTFESLHFEKQERVFTIPKLSKDGWVKEDGVWKYYKNDEAVTGWNKVGQKWYYMNAEGAMQTGWQKISKKWYYFNSSGAMQTGWQTIKNKKYYFNPSGAMQTGWQKIDSKWYYFESSGSMVTGWKQLSSKWYYFGTDGIMQTGWKTISGKTYYFKSSGVMAANEWYNGWWLNKDGTWTYKYKGSWHQNSKGWWFGDESGWYAKNTTITINNKQYTFDANGYMK